MNKFFSATAGVKYKTVGIIQVANYITQNNRGGQNTGRRYDIKHKSFLCTAQSAVNTNRLPGANYKGGLRRP